MPQKRTARPKPCRSLKTKGSYRFLIIRRCDYLAAALARSTMTVKRSLNELEDAGLILRVRQGFGEPNKIYILIPGKEDSRL